MLDWLAFEHKFSGGPAPSFCCVKKEKTAEADKGDFL